MPTHPLSSPSLTSSARLQTEEFFDPHRSYGRFGRIAASWPGVAAGALLAHNKITSISQEDNRLSGGEGGIRTPDTVTRMPHFECGAFNRSATSPTYCKYRHFPLMAKA
jgi:hypothetical protein